MRALMTSRDAPGRPGLAFLGLPPRTSQSRSLQLSNTRHRGFVPATERPSTPPNEVGELTVDIDGVPVRVRFLLTDISAIPSDPASGADLHATLSNILAKIIDKMWSASPRGDGRARQPGAAVELIASADQLARLPSASNDTVLRVGPLALDLLARTAKRGDRRIDLRPREFQLLKYMMERSDQLLTRAALLKEVWNYKFVPKTNLVDVHMGRLRRKIDGPGEPALIRNVRGAGFVLSPTPLPQ